MDLAWEQDVEVAEESPDYDGIVTTAEKKEAKGLGF